ncbi:DUF1489 family protein [Pseudochelatococcus contaminans]|uniref:Lysophospholipase n=1 Tax=Pseudochelatococcus contaminans TaxID=1538103 RepID=A0A7W5Z296_9HYPH|nr:hypothetical protein [Pseudochelatococcus contaminans]
MSGLNLLKLCVGIDSVAELTAWTSQRSGEHSHTTRMFPKRKDELLAGGSLYWVIKGQIACRQKLLDLCEVRGDDGISRCRLILDDAVVPVVPRPFRAFQGWRYLDIKDAPPDIGAGETAETAEMPESLRRDLAALGLL